MGLVGGRAELHLPLSIYSIINLPWRHPFTTVELPSLDDYYLLQSLLVASAEVSCSSGKDAGSLSRYFMSEGVTFVEKDQDVCARQLSLFHHSFARARRPCCVNLDPCQYENNTHLASACLFVISHYGQSHHGCTPVCTPGFMELPLTFYMAVRDLFVSVERKTTNDER